MRAKDLQPLTDILTSIDASLARIAAAAERFHAADKAKPSEPKTAKVK